ncbi:hypothetical protein [Aurantibacter sp.]|uniref:hypothetical protein n=1 Tax=Aurantibacter sp. TaxID=2807103 RepID=UPI003266D4C7
MMNMRKIGFYTLLLSFFVLTNCSKNSDDDSSQKVDKTLNLQATGDSANDILSNDKYTKLLIEIGYVTGFKPTTESITNFTEFLKEHTFKEDIEIIYKELVSPEKDSLSLNEIADLETTNRTQYNSGETLAIYIYFSDAPAEDDDEEEGLVTLGAVYRNTSMIIHEATVRSLSAQSFFITDADIETATLNHEFGHLFGLVDLGSPEVNPHEDSDSENHCDVEGCLMRAELQFGGPSNKGLIASSSTTNTGTIESACSLSGKTILSLLSNKNAKGAATVSLDDECILDLQANGGR